PRILWVGTDWVVHGLNVSDDGNRVYFADLGSSSSGSGTDGSAGLTILDVSQLQARVKNAKVTVVSHLTWPLVSIPQTPIPVTITTGSPPKPHRFLVEVDEFAKNIQSYDPDGPVVRARTRRDPLRRRQHRVLRGQGDERGVALQTLTALLPRFGRCGLHICC